MLLDSKYPLYTIINVANNYIIYMIIFDIATP